MSSNKSSIAQKDLLILYICNLHSQMHTWYTYKLKEHSEASKVLDCIVTASQLLELKHILKKYLCIFCNNYKKKPKRRPRCQFFLHCVIPATVAIVTFPCCNADAGTIIPWGLSVPAMALGIC